ncbi:MAG TPA: two-component regulator propeller domain-containing protein [Bacteroidia bacterium]|nr:two-component regulator propeller domain-containing protein [Bacteroidia bacterium]
MTRLIHNIFIVTFLFLGIAGYSQNGESSSNQINYKFKNFGTKDGLSLSSANCVIEDRFGIIWVGTADGLFKFNGYHFEAIKFNPEDETSLSGNIINCLLEDKEGNIWVGTDNGGLCMYKRKTKNFYRVPKLLWKKEFFKIQSISSIMQDSNGNIWFSNSQFQYFILDYKSKEIYPLKYDLLERLPDYYRITNMYEDKNKTVWLATQFGLYYSLSNYKKANGTFLVSKIYKKIPSYNFQTIIPNKSNSDSLYLVTNDGTILNFNVNTGTYRKVFDKITQKIEALNENLQSAIIDREGNWWFSTYRSGIVMYNLANDKIFQFSHEIYNNNSLSYNYLNRLYEDSNGLIWICTDGGGIDLINPGAKVFNVIRHDIFDKNTVSSNDIWGLYHDENFLYISTSVGLSVFENKLNKITNNKYQERVNSDESIGLMYSCVMKDDNGNIWVGTDGEGLLKFTQANGKFERLEIKNLKSLGISGLSASCVTYRENELWIGTFSEGLIRYNIKTKLAKVYKHSSNPNSIGQNAVTSLHFTDDNTLWISLQDNGVNRLDVAREHFTLISTTSKTTGRLSSDVAVSIIEDSFHTLWIGTERGLNAINQKNNKVYTFNSLPGGSLDIVYGIVEDNDHDMWISTNKGIFTFKLPRPEMLFDSPKQADNLISSTLKNFDDQNGLPSNEFNQGAFCKDNNGLIYFGGINGVVYFNPKVVKNIKNREPYLYLQAFNLFEKRLELDTIFDSKKLINLKYFENYFSIEFVSPSYLNPHKTRYRYIMEGLENSWTTTSYQNRINYSNVPPGNYRFRIMVTDSNGKWSTKEKSFNLNIEPPFWRTKYFYVISLLLIISLIALYVRLRERVLKRENRILEEKVKLRTADVIQQKEIVERKSNELESALFKINDNINYSNKIKRAILPSLTEIKKVFPETFIIYNPKLLVGGDFYFFSKQENSKRQTKSAVVGIADASGHGVSGALMSVIGLTMLNDIVNLKGITRPAHVLDELQLGVKETLKINEKNNYEAENMRCTICKFDFEKGQLEYAGARMSIYIIRNQNLIELKGDRMIIGAGSANLFERFTEKVFQLQHGDYIYLCTDGFSNQFGGEKGKKFKSKRLKEMLVSLHTTSHVIQDEQINHIFEQWQGVHERVDDLLIAGIRYSQT